MGALNPSDARLITFDLEKVERHLPSSIVFKILITMKNIIAHRCIIDEGASTCVMSTNVWKKLGSPELVPSIITLRAYDGQFSQPEGLYKNVPIELASKMVFIDVEVVDAPVGYNILLGLSYMYPMKAIALAVFHIMMFPHNGKIVPLDQLTYYDPKPQTNLDNVMPTLGGSQPITSYTKVSPGVFKYSTLLGTYHDPPPQLPSPGASLICTITSSNQPLATSSQSSGVPSSNESIS